MSQADVDVALRFYEVYNEHKLDLLDEILGPNYVGHVNAHDIKGAEAAKGFIGGFIDGIPDTKYTVEETLTVDNKVITRWVVTGTQTGNFFGTPPTNNAVNAKGITIFEIIDGKINQLWNAWDQFTLVQQLQGKG
jgi:steroid delta-isomerase-like uncharacterized protein